MIRHFVKGVIMIITSFMLLMFLGCSTDHTGDYKLIDVESDTETGYDENAEKFLGDQFNIEKVGERYILIKQGESDKLVFTPDGENYITRDSLKMLKFTGKKAILTLVGNSRNTVLILEKE